MKQQIVIFGNGKMAELAHFYFKHDSDFEVVAFTADDGHVKEETFRGLPLLPFSKVQELYPPAEYGMFIAIGYKKLNQLRTEKYHAAKALGYRLVSYVSSKSILWDGIEHGDNCFILENQVFQPNVRIGDNVFIWSGNHFGHDVTVESHSYLASHIVLSGGVTIGEGSFVGINAALRDGVSVGRGCIIGAGALILRNTKENEVYISQQTALYRLDSIRFEQMMEISSR